MKNKLFHIIVIIIISFFVAEIITPVVVEARSSKYKKRVRSKRKRVRSKRKRSTRRRKKSSRKRKSGLRRKKTSNYAKTPINPNHVVQRVLKLLNTWDTKKFSKFARVARNIALYQLNDKSHRYLPAVLYEAIEQRIIKLIQDTKFYKIKECLSCKMQYISLDKNKFYVRRQILDFKNMKILAKERDIDAFLLWGVYMHEKYTLVNLRLVEAHFNEVIWTETLRSDNFQKITRNYTFGMFFGSRSLTVKREPTIYNTDILAETYESNQTSIFGIDIDINGESPLWTTKFAFTFYPISDTKEIYSGVMEIMAYQGYNFSKSWAIYGGLGCSFFQWPTGVVNGAELLLEYKLSSKWRISIGGHYSSETKITYVEEKSGYNIPVVNPTGGQMLIHYKF